VLGSTTTDNDHARGNADAGLKLFGQFEPRYRLDQGQSTSRRPLRIVFVRARIAKIDHDPVAHISRDETIETPRDLGNGLMIGGDQITQVLGIPPHRQCGRADEVAEHDRELPALNAGRSRNRIRSRAAAQCRNGGEQFAPVPDEVDTDVPEILGGQFGQYRCVNRVVAKRLLVLLQSEAAEPICDVHAYSPMRLSPSG